MEDLANADTYVNDSLVDREKNEPTKAITWLASNLCYYLLFNPDNDDMVLYLGNFDT